MKKKAYQHTPVHHNTQHTYAVDGEVMKQGDVLKLKRPDGELRFALLNAIVGALPGTLVCRSNPLNRLQSIEAAEAEFARRRQSEGHFGKQMMSGHLAVAAAGSGNGSREAN